MRSATLAGGALALLAVLLAAHGAHSACSGAPPAIKNGQWTAAAYNAASGSTVAARCNTGYNSTPPTATCTGSSWSTPSPAQCFRTCPGLPPALTGGRWPASCATTVAGGWCYGVCESPTQFGAPAIQCGGGTWSLAQMGRCSDKPVCSGQPPQPLNAKSWPAWSLDTAVGGSAAATCNPGYFAANSPTSRCTEGGWQPVVPSACTTGPISNGTAFITNYDGNSVSVCLVSNASVVAASCVVTTSDEFFAATGVVLDRPAGVAVVGDTVWVSAYSGVVFVSTFNAATRKLVPQRAVNVGGEDVVPQIVVDPRTLVAYITVYRFPATQNSILLVCSDALTLADCASTPLPAAWGIALSPSQSRIFFTATTSEQAAVLSCPLATTGLAIDMARCTRWNQSSIPSLTNPYAVTVSSDGSLMIITNNDGRELLVCSTGSATPSCTTTLGAPSNLFSGIGYQSISTGQDGIVWIPNYGYGGVNVCAPVSTSSPASCQLSGAGATPGAVGIFITP